MRKRRSRHAWLGAMTNSTTEYICLVSQLSELRPTSTSCHKHHNINYSTSLCESLNKYRIWYTVHVFDILGVTLQCAIGTEFSRTPLGCTPCPVGTYRDRLDIPQCVNCPPATTTAFVGAHKRDACKQPDVITESEVMMMHHQRRSRFSQSL